jgi:translation initiation factor 5B
MEKTRKLICTVLGHVDHGKSSLLDKIRGTCIVKCEPGAITQAIGASIIPLETIEKKCCGLLESTNFKVTIPGLLFIDTPGHAAFINLRKRGGALADISILVIDVIQGIEPQTEESIEILRKDKTPFIIAANKIDRIPGWKQQADKKLVPNIKSQAESVQTDLDNKMYEIVGKLSEKGFNAERFDRIEDFKKQIAICPVSALTGEGVPEILMMLLGLAQKFLGEGLVTDVNGPAKGTILEVKETVGLGTTLDVIIFDGTLKKNDTIVIGGIGAPIVTKVRALLEPAPLAEMRDEKSKFIQLSEVTAATGVKISATGIDGAVAGMPIRSCKDSDLEKVKQEIQEEVGEVVIQTDDAGLIIKADSLGSLEALIMILKENEIPIRRASIGNINKKDVAEASSNKEQNPLFSAILGFNVNADEAGSLASDKDVKILLNQVIYRLLEDYKKWRDEARKKIEAQKLDKLVKPCKLLLLKGYVFRQNNPAIVGTEVLEGTLKPGIEVMKDGKAITRIKSMQKEQENATSAKRGEQLAVAYENVTVGRQIQEGDIIYSVVPEADFKQMKELKEYLSKEEVELLKEIAIIMRKRIPMWGV